MAEPKIKRRLAAILAADIAGYSRLMGEDEAATVRDLKGHQAVVLPMIGEFGGRIIDTAGDGVLAEFPSAVGALECAVELQRVMAVRNQETPEHRRMQFRVGINLGDVIHDETRIYGDGINVAARLENIAEPGGICISEDLHRQVQDKLSVSYRDLGEQELKNIVRPVRVFAVNDTGDAAGADFGISNRVPDSAIRAPRANDSMRAPAIRRLSIVVLPFANASGDPNQDYFSDGVTEEVTTQLSKIKGAYVIGRNTAFAYRGKRVDIKALGRELGVRYVLQGRVDRFEDGADTNVELTDCLSGAILWSDTIEVDKAGVRNIRKEVVSRMTIALNLQLMAAEARRAEIENPDNPDAVDLVMRGWWAFYSARTPEQYQQVQKTFETALAVQPDWQPALVGRARALTAQAFLWAGPDRQHQLEQAESDAIAAISRDPGDALAHQGLARIWMLQGRIEAAIVENESALELNPNLTDAFSFRGGLFVYNGQAELAIEPLMKALAQSPRDPHKGFWLFWLGLALCVLGKYRESIPWLEKSAALMPYPATLGILLAAYAQMGETEMVSRVKTQLLRMQPDISITSLKKLAQQTSSNSTFLASLEQHVLLGLHKAGVKD
jgi:adenylate cyclase